MLSWPLTARAAGVSSLLSFSVHLCGLQCRDEVSAGRSTKHWLGTDDDDDSNGIAVAGAVLGALGLLLAILVAIRQHTDVKRLEDQIDAISPAHVRHQSNIAARLAADVEQPYSLPAYTTSPRYSAPQGPENVYKANPNGQSIRLVQPHVRRESTM